MNFDDMFKPYSPKIRGDLKIYLREHDGMRADSLFHGSEYFFVIRDKGWMIPGYTYIRVNQSPIPDIGYFVNDDFLLESMGTGDPNMSLMGAKKGIYDPSDALKDRTWSISGLELEPDIFEV
ncbi:MAG: hypothetical protein ABIJ92_00780 [Candidatus Aenigmatarchaeota archaeon]